MDGREMTANAQDKHASNEKIWEVVIQNTNGGQQTVKLTKDELAEVDPDRIVVLMYIGEPPEPYWKRRPFPRQEQTKKNRLV